MGDRTLPPIEVVDDGAGPEDSPPRGWALGSWRDTPVPSALAVGLLGVALLAAAWVRLGGDESSGSLNALQEWAADHHTGDPPASITLPDVTCPDPSGEIVALRACLRDALARGEGATGHVRADLSYPDAIDYWATVHPDGTGRYVQRIVTVEDHPDVDAGLVRPSDLRRVVTSWVEAECGPVTIATDGDDVLPGFECDEGRMDDGRRHEASRPTTEDERADLTRRFACTYPSMRERYDC